MNAWQSAGGGESSSRNGHGEDGRNGGESGSYGIGSGEQEGGVSALPSGYAVVCPVASAGVKRWPARSFAVVADWLREKRGTEVVLLTGGQPGLAEAINEHARSGPLPEVGRLHLLATAHVLRGARVVLCNDTGMLHLAAAVGTPTVGLFGPTARRIYQPRQPWVRGLQGSTRDCPYFQERSMNPPLCWHYDRCLVARHSCIHSIRIGEVIRAVQSALEAPEHAPGRAFFAVA